MNKCISTLMLSAVTIFVLVNNPTFAEENLAENAAATDLEIAEYIKWYPAIKQVEMRDAWLQKYNMGEWQFTGAITADEKTVVTPQAGTNYGYSWFNISNEPVVITIPEHEDYYSVSIFDMNHYMEVFVAPKKTVVVRLPHQKSPVEGALEVVIQTYQGLAFTRQVMVDNEQEIMDLASRISISGGGGDFPFVLPEFRKEVQAAGQKTIHEYVKQGHDAARYFVSPYEGGSDIDRAAGVLAGQLGTQARYAQYGQLIFDQHSQRLNGKDSYKMLVPELGLVKNDVGYWTVTIYSQKDRLLIPNERDVYYISSYNAKANSDGSYTIHINPEGSGDNAIPSSGVDFYGIFRVYEPAPDLVFPALENISKR